jgi:hypothetical protein
MLLATAFVERLFCCAHWIGLGAAGRGSGPPKTGLGRLQYLCTSDVEQGWMRVPADSAPDHSCWTCDWRTPTLGGGRAEQDHRWSRVSAGQVSNSGIPADDQASISHQRSQAAKIKSASQHTVWAEASGLGHSQATPAFRGGPGDHHRLPGHGQASSHCTETVDRPAAGLGLCAGMHDYGSRNGWRPVRLD